VRAAVLAATLALACSARPLDAPRVDGGPVTCEGLVEEANRIASRERRCAKDSDCTVVRLGACFYVGNSCAVEVNQSGASDLQPLLDAWSGLGCGNEPGCPCPEPRYTPSCLEPWGVCN
jgi:hypothetical protein